MAEGDFVLVVRGEPHVLRSGRTTKPIPLAIDGRRMSVSSITAVEESHFRR
jgi:hypothetical protein